MTERDERIAEARRRAEDDREAIAQVGSELGALYGDPDELLKHARVVSLDEIEENEFNLSIPRYVDTFEPEPQVEVREALEALKIAEDKVRLAENEVEIVSATKAKLQGLVKKVGALQQLKKSLMHDLLTGKVRVNNLNLDKVAAL